MALDWTAIRNALYTAVTSAAGSTTCVWEKQAKAPQPAMPYIGLFIGGVARALEKDALHVDTDLGQPAGQEVILTTEKRANFTLTLQAYTAVTDGSGSAFAILSGVQTAIGLPSIRAALYAAGLAMLESGDIQVLDEVLPDWQGRASLDIRFAVTDTASENTGYIGSANPQEAYS